ncbi:MAG: hypothetical protein QOH47_2450 [Sphingomonadales bacterium]|jgi:hypothetical protein|nr:hypothetical protein [Sphingomonadales bacterium]
MGWDWLIEGDTRWRVQRAQRKKPGPRMTPERADALRAAVRTDATDEEIAASFDIGLDMLQRYRGRG